MSGDAIRAPKLRELLLDTKADLEFAEYKVRARENELSVAIEALREARANKCRMWSQYMALKEAVRRATNDRR